MEEKIIKDFIDVVIGDNPEREGLKDTPRRVSKMSQELFKGYDESKKPIITVFSNGADGVSYDEMIIDSGYFFSYCEHHIVPFFGSYFFGYIPKDDGEIIGLSKVARVVDYHAAKLQIQERLTKDIVDEIEEAINPLGIGLVLKARHLCKEMRGVKKVNGQMITSDTRGVFRTKPEARAEFLRFIDKRS